MVAYSKEADSDTSSVTSQNDVIVNNNNGDAHSTAYSESITIGVVQERTPSMTYTCNLDHGVHSRTKQEVLFGQGLKATSFQNKIVVFSESTRRKFKATTFYEQKTFPKTFSETFYVRPKGITYTILSSCDNNVRDRKWYQNKVRMPPNTQVSVFEMEHPDWPQEDVNQEQQQVVDNEREEPRSYSTSIFVNGRTTEDEECVLQNGVNGHAFENGF